MFNLLFKRQQNAKQFDCAIYYLAFINCAQSVCMGANLDLGRAYRPNAEEVCTHDRGQDSPIQTD